MDSVMPIELVLCTIATKDFLLVKNGKSWRSDPKFGLLFLSV